MANRKTMTPTQLIKTTKDIMWAHQRPNQEVVFPPDIQSDLRALLVELRHDRCDDLNEATHLSVARGPGPVKDTNYGIWLHFTDREPDAIGIKAVREASARTKLLGACRTAVHEDTQAERKRLMPLGYGVCAATGARCRAQDLDLDHKSKPFSVIVDEYFDGIELKDDMFKRVGIEWQFDDADIAELFREYHKTQADYQLLTKSANSSKGARTAPVPRTR